MDHRGVGAVVVVAAMAIFFHGHNADAQKKITRMDQAMFFHSAPQDALACGLEVAEDGSLHFPPAITNPAASCPDAAAWKVFFDAIQDEFWKNWAVDTYTWPEQPLPLCGTEGADPDACCDPASATNPGYAGDNPGQYCPFYPGDHADFVDKEISPPGTFRPGHGTFIDRFDPGRVLRQETAEIVFRNRPMFQYVFENGFYSQQGLARAFAKAQSAAQTAAPFRQPHATIEFPIASVAFKGDWVHQDGMLAMGLIQSKDGDGNPLDPPQDPDFPYVTMNISDSVPDDDPERFKPGLHYLVGGTVSTKDLPRWLWFAVEHVNNPGRCDYNGCNDSFGYRNPQAPEGSSANFVPPNQIPDNLDQGFMVFDLGKSYPPGEISPALVEIYDKLGISDTVDSNPDMPSPTDHAWRSYRLKGTQTQFVTSEGKPTVVGNSVTEGGFVNSSSCITCHAQASVGADGSTAIVNRGFDIDLNLFGYPRSSNGPPDLDWFYAPGSNTYRALQFDFMWGFAFVKPELTPDKIPADLK